jgi:hypothetical protein
VGNGNGTFQSAVNYPVGSYPRSVAAADLNGDGLPDLVVANDGGHYGVGNTVSVLLTQRNVATQFGVIAPASATAGTPFTITVTAVTADNHLDPRYTGTVHFTCTDGAAVLPVNYTFTLADAGSHWFVVTLKTAGSQTITATDTSNSTLSGQATVSLTAPGPAAPQGGGGSQGGSSAPPPGATPAADSGSTTAATIPLDAAYALTVPTLEPLGSGVTGSPSMVGFRSWDGPAALPDPYPLMSTADRRPPVPATPTALPSRGTLPAAVPGERGRPSADAAGDDLSPASIEAFFAQW